MSRCHLCREEDTHSLTCPYGEKTRYPRRFRRRQVNNLGIGFFLYGVYFPSTHTHVVDLFGAGHAPGKPEEGSVEWLDKEQTG